MTTYRGSLRAASNWPYPSGQVHLPPTTYAHRLAAIYNCVMSKPRTKRESASAATVYPWRITMPAIRKLAREIAVKFQPEKIILFGSYAYGSPHQDSDVDLLVIMPARDSSALAVRILEHTDPPFPVDLLVRTPYTMNWRLKAGDWFLREIDSKGKVLYEKGADPRVDKESGARSHRRQKTRSVKRRTA